jgi:hypothetical protein
MPLTFPAHLFNPTSVKLSDAGRAIVSPGTISGVVQALRTDGGGLVKIDYAGINLRNADLQRAWEAWRVELGGGAELVNVPALSLARAPRPLQGGRLARVGALHVGNDLDPYFPEVVGYGAPIIVATINPAGLRATSVTINVAQGSRVVGGQVFEITHPTFGKRIYQTGRILSRSDQSTTVSIWPPLREAIPSTAHVNFDWPCLTCRLVPDSDISPDISFGGASVSISFVEAF